jgi:hypothetical protein
MPLTRKHFLSAAAAGASIATLASASAAKAADTGDMRSMVKFHNLKSGDYDAAAMLKTLAQSSDHKQVFQSVSPIIIVPGLASLYLHMQNSMNAYQFSLGLGNLSTLGVLIGPSIAFALTDAMWTKYNIGKALGSDLAATNTYYKATSNLDPGASPDDPNGLYQDWSAQAVLKRGGAFFVCHNATTGIAMVLASKMGGDPKVALADFEKNLLPGFQMVPAGVAAMQQAQENGWKPFPII